MPDPHRERECPKHGKLRRVETRYGGLWVCDHSSGCTVKCWDGSTSTPADGDTRKARMKIHALFDALWNNPKGVFSRGKRKNTRSVRRHRAYLWLSQRMGLPMKDTHVGMFTLDQCVQADKCLIPLYVGPVRIGG